MLVSVLWRTTMVCYQTLCFLMFTLPPVLFSIRFDEYYDADAPQNSLNLNEIPCFQVGSKCDMTSDCCGVATCALPSWSSTPVCLVPGYKEDDKLERMSNRNPPRLEDILYIRNTYNTTFYDFLLSDFTSPKTELNNESVSTVKESVVAYNSSETSEDFFGKDSNPQMEISIENSSHTDNESSSNILSDPFNLPTVDPDLSKILQEKAMDDIIPISNVTEAFHKLNQSLLKRHKFLLINSTIKTNKARTNLSLIYDTIKDSDKFKNVVKLLQQKLKEINEKERKLMINPTAEGDVQMSESSLTTQTTPTSTKPSKWDVVRNFFLPKEKKRGNLKTPQKIKYFIEPPETFTYSQSLIESKDDLEKESTQEENNKPTEILASSEGIREIMNRFVDISSSDKLLENNEKQLLNAQYSNEAAYENILEMYNINIPYTYNLKTNGEVAKKQTGPENILGPRTMPSAILDTKSKSTLNRYDKELFSSNLSKKSTKSPKVSLKTTTIKKNKIFHLWNEAYLWPIKKNVSEKLIRKFKKLFVSKNKSNSSVKRAPKIIPLNEHFLLTFNSKNVSERLTIPKSDQNLHVPDYSFGYSSSDESVSPDSEDLYNSSYVFVVNRVNISDAKKQSKFARILDFFHITRLDSSPIHKNLSTSDSQKSTETVSKKSSEAIFVEEVIKLPEHLMPEALEGRRLNDSEFWLVEDSIDFGDKSIKESKSSNNTFFFFFR